MWWSSGGALVFQAGYHPRKRTFTLNTHFSGMKIDPKYTFLHAFFFFNLSVMSLKFVTMTKNIPFSRLSFSPYILTVLGTEIVPLTPQ